MEFFSEKDLLRLIPVGGNWVILMCFGGFYSQITRKSGKEPCQEWGFSHDKKIYVS